MFNEQREKKKAHLENVAKNMSSEVLLSLTRDKAMVARAKMMDVLRQLADEFNSVHLWGDPQIIRVIKMGYDERHKRILRQLVDVCQNALDEIEKKDQKIDLSKMYALDDMLHDLNNWRI
jgi:hypothetical protein